MAEPRNETLVPSWEQQQELRDYLLANDLPRLWVRRAVLAGALWLALLVGIVTGSVVARRLPACQEGIPDTRGMCPPKARVFWNGDAGRIVCRCDVP